MQAEAKAIDAPRSSASTSSVPRTRKAAGEYADLGMSPQLPEELRQVVIGFYFDIGADNQLPEDRSARDSYLNRVHDKLVVSNPKVPDDVDFGIIYSHFFHEVLYKRELKGHSPKHLLDVMNLWITKKETRDKLRNRHNELFPEQAPKQLLDKAGQSGSKRDKAGQLDLRYYVDEPPDEVAQLVRTINKMEKSSKEFMNNDSGKSYWQRLLNTYEKYKEEGKL